ncbi:MAG: hypothetical protein CMN30_30030 [Sandaracinus sp.]|nr:hypothetical protein [Sandaracinus sp.]MAR55929.1 hypothetical protein [Rickettsiales bacterium]
MTVIRIEESVTLPVTPEVTYGMITSEPGYETFIGWGPIPAIQGLEWHQGNPRIAGSHATVFSSDGSTHSERVVVAEPPYHYAVAIGDFASAFRLLTEGATERWVLSDVAEGTRIDRTFEFRLRSPLLWPLGAAFGAAFRKAVRVSHDEFRRITAPA